MPSAAPIEPRKTPRQARARATYEAIVEAAARILETDGPAGFNTNAVAARAGVSVGSLYQYFPHKQALVAELSGRAARRLLSALTEAVDAASSAGLEADVRRLARAAIAWQGERPALERALDQLEEGLGLDSDARGTTEAIGKLIARLLRDHRPDLDEAGLRQLGEDALALSRALIDRAGARDAVLAPQLETRLVGAICGLVRAID